MQPLHGEVHGSIIKLTEDPGLPEGQQVEVLVTATPAASEEPKVSEGLKRAAGGLTDWSEEDNRILAEIQAERHRPTRRFSDENDPFK